VRQSRDASTAYAISVAIGEGDLSAFDVTTHPLAGVEATGSGLRGQYFAPS
jgi:hypothetical protein